MKGCWLRGARLAFAVLAALEAAAAGAVILLSFPETDKAETAGPPVRWLQARRLNELPEVDGSLTDPCWERAARSAWAGPEQRPAVTLKVGAWGGTLCLGLRVEGPAEGAWADFLFDAQHDHASCQALRVWPDGRWSASAREKGKAAEWPAKVEVAARREEGAWTVEGRLDRASLSDPENGVIGFNVVAHAGGDAAWNSAGPGASLPENLGHLVFETTPLTVRAVGTGTLVRGENRLTLTVGADPGSDVDARALVTVRPASGRPAQRRYRFVAPAGQTQVLALGFPMWGAGTMDLEVALMDAGLQRVYTRFARRGLTAEEGLRIVSLERREGALEAVAEWPFGPEERQDMSVVATLKAPGAGHSLAHARVDGPPSKRMVARVPEQDLPEGTHELRITLARRGDLVVTRRVWLRKTATGEGRIGESRGQVEEGF